MAVGALGHRVKPTAEGDVVVVDKGGVRLFSLGQARGATFNRAGTFVYAWDSSTGALYDVAAGKKLATHTLGVEDFNGAGFTANGARIIEVGQGIRLLSVPELKVTFEVKGGYSELHQSAQRAVTLQDVTPKKTDAQLALQLVVIDIEKEKIVGTLPMNEAFRRVPKIAFSADGKKMSMSMAGTQVWDTTINKVIPVEKGDFPEHERYEPGPAFFSPDSNSMCIEQMGSKRAISIFNVPKGTVRHCFIVPREGHPWTSEVSQADFAAKLVHIPVTPGTVHPSGLSGLYYHVTMEALSQDQHTVAVIEQAKKEVNRTVESWLVIADVDASQVKHRLSLSTMSTDIHRFEVRFAGEDRAVVVWNGDDGKGLAFDVATGAAIAVPANFQPGDF